MLDEALAFLGSVLGVIKKYKLVMSHHQMYVLLDCLKKEGYDNAVNVITRELSKRDDCTYSMFIGPGLKYLRLDGDSLSKFGMPGRRVGRVASAANENRGTVPRLRNGKRKRKT